MIFHTIDNFFSDPKTEHQKALCAQYKTELHNGISYRGIALTEDTASKTKIERTLLETLSGPSTIYYRRYFENEENETYIHSDCQIGKYTTVIYLTQDALCQGGTAFWRHRKYGWAMQPTKEEMHRAGIPDTKEFWEEIYHEGFDEKYWELLSVAPMKFNRAVIFDSRRFHSRYPKKSFGTKLEDARLVKVLFLNDDPSFVVTPFDATRDYQEVSRWWVFHKWPIIPLNHLSKQGFVIWDKIEGKAIAAIWVYATDSAFSWLEFLISNPDICKRKKIKALELLVRAATNCAFASGASSIFSSLSTKGLVKLFERAGFSARDSEMTNLVLTK